METFRPLFPVTGIPYLFGRSLSPYHLLFFTTSGVQLFALLVLQSRFIEEKSCSLRHMLQYFTKGILVFFNKLRRRAV